MGWIRHLIFWGLATLAVAMGLILYGHNLVFVTGGPENGFLLTKSPSVRYSLYLPAFYVHIVTGSIVLITGVFQLSERLRARYPAWHRTLGKIYVMVLLIFTAPSGLIMSFYANGGWSAQVGFGLLATLWWLFTGRGFQLALQKQWPRHREFMLRSYALTFSAVTLRLYSFFFALAGLRGEFIYNIIVWLCWVPSLLVVELWLRRTRESRRQLLA